MTNDSRKINKRNSFEQMDNDSQCTVYYINITLIDNQTHKYVLVDSMDSCRAYT